MWANAKDGIGRPGEPPDNLLLVKPYHWKPFMGYADVNNSSGNDLSKTDKAPSLANSTMKGEEDDVQLVSDGIFLTFDSCVNSFIVSLCMNW